MTEIKNETPLVAPQANTPEENEKSRQLVLEATSQALNSLSASLSESMPLNKILNSRMRKVHIRLQQLAEKGETV